MMRFIDDKRRRAGARSLLRDTRGGVHTEGAMVAVLLATLFGGFLWIHGRTRAEIDAVRSAGRDLWRPALEGCDDGAPAPARGWIGGYRGVQRDVAPEAADRLEDVRTSDTVTNEVRHARRPEILGGGLVEVRTRAGTACNTAMVEGEIAWQGRVVELFCERYPLEPNWGAGCDLGERPPSGE
ncbi:hypothetical protein [Sandaracinus amylolyticus]|uniref:Uncharacterized protein n=1 Tax=Sandaracinus amylolyticus TaxID=927083 RepID=A0A0F6YLG4_9BACT|nr:hypothetical protein [Sandaracinus amylolyticus]AKF08316.1 hypothetical protein DB32_005465 [Sandaracinus amylolyticus]